MRKLEKTTPKIGLKWCASCFFVKLFNLKVLGYQGPKVSSLKVVDIIEILHAVVMVDIVDVVDIDLVDIVEIIDNIETAEIGNIFVIVDMKEAIWNKARL